MTLIRLLVIASAVLIGMAGGCASGGDLGTVGDDRPSTNPSFVPGYYEVTKGGDTYVLGSSESYDNLRLGNPPKRLVRRFSAKGTPVFFEANDAGLEWRLMNEFEKRHGLTQRI